MAKQGAGSKAGPEPPVPGKGSPGGGTRTRVISALIVAPLVLAAVLWSGGDAPFPGWPFALLALGMILVALREFYNGCRAAGRQPLDGFGYAAGLLLLLAATPLAPDGGVRLIRVGLTLLLMGSLVYEALRPERAPLQNLAPTWLGALYVGWLLPFAVRLRLIETGEASRIGWELPGGWMQAIAAGAWLLVFTLVVTSAVDTGAYLAGKSLGRHKLAPAVSPGKTWEGSIGGFLAALVAGALIGWWLRLPLPFALTAAALVGVVAQLGDLSKSAIKREIGIKDFGTLIPGHGGILDRFDSLLFTAPAVYWLLILWPR